MAGQIGEAFVRIRPDTTGFKGETTRAVTRDMRGVEKQFAATNQEIGKFSRGSKVGASQLALLGRSAAFASVAFIGGAGLVQGLRYSVSAASNLDEQISKTNVVFGKSAQEIKDWSETSANALGLARDQALEVASSFGALFRPLGIVGKVAAEQSEKLTQLGADLASFYNTDVSSALAAIRSGIVGESEPLRQYGVLLSETRVQAEALALTHKKTAAALTDQEKVLARISLITKDSAQAQGDYARTSDGLANKSRSLKANLRDVATTVGQSLTPALNNAAYSANAVLGAVNDLKRQDLPSALTVDPVRAALIPKLADDYGRLRANGASAADAIKVLTSYLEDDLFLSSAKSAQLLGDAINYFSGGPLRAQITKLRQEVRGLGTDAETAAKLVVAAGIRAAQVAAAAPRGEAALPEGERLDLALSVARGTKTKADDLAVLVKQRELFATQIKSLENRLSHAKGAKARDLADQLRSVLADDQSALDEINSIQQDADYARQKAADEAEARAARDAKAASTAYQRSIAVQAKNLATAARAGGPESQAAKAYNDFLRRELSDFRIADSQRAAFRARLQANREGLAADQHKDAEDAKKAIDRFVTLTKNANAGHRKALADAKEAATAEAENQRDIQDQLLENNLAKARLIRDPKKELVAERAAQKLIVQLWQGRANNTKLTIKEQLSAQGEFYRQQKILNDLNSGDPKKIAKAGAGAGFSLADLFAEAGREFAAFGSNVGAGPLSGQDARKGLAGTVKASQTVVVQHFYGERGTAQAMNDARSTARNLK